MSAKRPAAPQHRKGGHQRPGRARHQAVNVGVAIALATVAVGALVVLVVNNQQAKDHAVACRTYRDALVVAYADPLSTARVVGLNAADTATVKHDRQTYQAAYQAATHPPAPPPTTPGQTLGQGLARALHDTPPSPPSEAGWHTGAAKFVDHTMAQRGC